MRRGDRVVHGDKELIEKLGRNDLCPCRSGRRFQKMLPAIRPFRRQRAQLLCPGLTPATSSWRLCIRTWRVGRAARHRGANATRPKGLAGSTPALSATQQIAPFAKRPKASVLHTDIPGFKSSTEHHPASRCPLRRICVCASRSRMPSEALAQEGLLTTHHSHASRKSDGGGR